MRALVLGMVSLALLAVGTASASRNPADGSNRKPDAVAEAPGMARILLDGNKLLRYCTMEPKKDADRNAVYRQGMDVGVCSGFIAGIQDAAQVTGAVSGIRACLPPDVTLVQSKAVVIEYLEANPGKRHHSAAALAMIALIEAFPCP